ncbi:MAG: endonuclease MutS2 [Candidatus Kapaibacterium sp.]
MIDQYTGENQLIEESLNQLEFKSVLKYISRYAYSELGYRQVMESRPMEDIYWLRNEHLMIDEMKGLLTLDDSLPFDGLSDARQKLEKSLVENAVLTATEMLSVFEVIRVFRLVKKYFHAREEKYPALWELAQNMHDSIILEKHISDAIDDDGQIKDDASVELQRIRREIFEKSNRLRSKIQNILKRVGEQDMLQDDYVSMREGRFVIPLRSEHKWHMPGIIHGTSQTGATVFLEPSEVIEMNNGISILHSEENREIYRILSMLTTELGQEAREFLKSLDIMAHIDAVRAKARYANDWGGIKPDIIEHNEIWMKDIRHPLLVHAKSRDEVIPMSIDFSDEQRGHLISGPNAGGKTVALKSVGLGIAMALSGIFPLGECKTNIRRIFTSIGDHQSIENDLSTFSSQMYQIKEIISYSMHSALVLIDEIGSGTDPREGAALACGILDTFIEMKLFFIATTHQSSLKTYALNRDVIANASLEFDEEKLKPTYGFLPGIPGNSYAFFLAKNIGMSDLVLKRARSYLSEKEKELEHSISLLQKYRFESVKKRAEADKEKYTLEKSRKKYENKLEQINLRREEIIEKARHEASEIVKNANALIENTIREVQEQKRPFAEIKADYEKQKQAIEERVRKLEDSREKKADVRFEPGDDVVMEESNSRGTVLEVHKEDKQALVEFNGFKFRLPFRQLTKISSPEKKKSSSTDYIRFDAKTRLDLRGMRADEALKETDDFISDALMANQELLTIIHGKGTGALRQAIHDYLKHHPSVSSFRLGDLVEGGSGVTIVTL